MKFISIFLGLLILSFVSFLFIGAWLGAKSTDEAMLGIIVLAIQNCVMITILILIALKLKNKKG